MTPPAASTGYTALIGLSTHIGDVSALTAAGSHKTRQGKLAVFIKFLLVFNFDH